MLPKADEFDIVVVGGGPAGSTVASFVAMQGHRVLLLEKEVFPVYKIGESLLPSTVNGICNLLGVSEELKRANFVRKQGGTFRWGKNKEPWTFSFSESSKFSGPTSFAYQVERMKFDLILLNNARKKGVDVREQSAVVDVIINDRRVVGVEFLDNAGVRRIARCKYVVDSSGHTSALAQYSGERIYSQFFRNVAIFGYYLHGRRLPAPCSGNIFCAAFDKGWFWYIPLSDTLTSVGAVIGQEYAGSLRQDHEASLTAMIAECGPIRDLLSGAVRVTDGPYGAIRIRKDYSYCHTRFWRPGLALVGDAACFIDPVFSSGVHLATYSALLAARSINTCMRKLVDEERAFTEFEGRYLREYRHFYDFLIAFYDVGQELDGYYWAARKVMNSPERGNEAFIQLVGGIGESQEVFYKTANAFMEARKGIDKPVFPTGEGTSHDVDIENKEKGFVTEQFLRSLTTEAVQIQLQAANLWSPSYAVPLFDNGLIPSNDGFHWMEPLKSGDVHGRQ
jgi:halogenation protein CepH